MKALAFVLIAGLAGGCGAPATAGGTQQVPDQGASSLDRGITPGAPARAGIVVIDVQDWFVKQAAQKDIDQIIDNTAAVLALAGKHRTPLFVTFEHSRDEAYGFGLPAKLKGKVPAHASEFIKTTFAATGNKAFASAVRQSGLTHFVVLGAETDVCVLQSVLGLRSMGFAVILQQDAVFTSEPNAAPALRRMRQAGVQMAGMAEVRSFIDGTRPLPGPPSPGAITTVKPLNIAVVLNHFDDAGSPDPRAAEKHARLRELLLISEWFDMPLYAAGSHALPAKYAGLIKKQVQPFEKLTANASVEQVVIAGTDRDVAGLAAAHGKTHDVFLLEDALLAFEKAADQAALLEALYKAGAVPITYKSLYYGMTKSVDLKEWPSQSWVERDPEYYPKTRAPEDLPPMVN
jgi:nicotinamidase-related amidase